MMIKILFLGTLALMSSVTAMADVLQVGRALPNVSLLKDGKLVDLKSEVKGKTMIHLFASW